MSLSGLALLAAEKEVPVQVRQGIEEALKKKVANLVAERNSEGMSYKRGAYSQTFHEVDPTTYTVGFTRDTASLDRMKTERLVLTLKQQGGGWAVANEEVKDTFEGMVRTVVGSGDWYSVPKLTFEKEGLKVSGTNVTMYVRRLEGKVTGALLMAPDLKYTYEPPANLPTWSGRHYPNLQAVLEKRTPDQFNFEPEYAEVECDPTWCETLFPFITTSKPIATGEAGIDTQVSNPDLVKLFKQRVKDAREEQRSNPFSGFRLPWRPDRRYWSWQFKRQGREQYAQLQYDNYEPREMTFYHSEYGPLFSYYAEESLVEGADPYDLELRPDSDARYYDLQTLKGTVSLAVDGDVVDGDITYTMEMKQSVRELPFFISRRRLPTDEQKDAVNPRMFINSIQDGDGNELTWCRLGAFGGLVIFPKAPAVGQNITLRLQFKNLDSIRMLNPSYSEMDRGGWLPFVRFTDMISDFDLVVKVPQKYTVLGIGKKVSESVENGLRVTRWVSKYPVSFPTVIFGDYISDVPGFKATKIDGTEIPVRVSVDKGSTRALDTKIMETTGTEKDAEEFNQRLGEGARDIRGKQLRSIAEMAANALNLYKTIYKVDYPYDKLDLVADPQGSFYGQAPASIIYLGFGVFRGEGFVAGGPMFGGGSDISKFNKDVVAHETAHQWWGSLINNANFRNYWFIETLAEYSSALYVEAVNSDGGKNPAKGRQAYLEKVEDWRKRVLDVDMVGSVNDATVSYGGEFPGAAYQAAVYMKGPYIFHVMRQTFGDQKFFEFLANMTTTFQHRPIITRDIQQTAERTFGVNMESFFDQWIRGVGIPQYAVNWTFRKNEEGKYLLMIKMKQRVVFGKEKTVIPDTYYAGVLPITVVMANGQKKNYKIGMEGPEKDLPVITLPDVPVEVVVNKEGGVLAHDVLVNRPW